MTVGDFANADPTKSLKSRAGWPVVWLSSAAAASSASIAPTNRLLRARPNRKSTPSMQDEQSGQSA